MKRILHIVGNLNRGGAETWLIQVLRRLDRQEFQFDFVVHSDGPFQYQAEIEALGSKVLVCRGFTNPLLYGVNLLDILRRRGPYDCLHSHMHHFSGIPLLIARIAGTPMRVVHSHLDTSVIDQDAGVLRRSYTGVMKRVIWSCCTTGTAASIKAADALFPPGWRADPKWKVLHYGIELEPYQQPVPRHEIRKQLGIPNDALVIGHIGRFEGQKNHAFLLNIAAEVVRIMPKAIFLLVGDGPLRPVIEHKAKTMNLINNLIFTGVRTDVPLLMQGVMDVFLFPSCYEGLGLVLLEAQASGLPCLISDQIPSEADVIKDLVIREALTTPPQRWAERLLGLRDSRRNPSPEALSDTWSVDLSMDRLINLYQ
jgi:glycosyltransferase involved in cell wall biosynthesis